MPSMVPRGWILIAVMIHWFLLYCHQQVDICASDWKVSDKTGSIYIQKKLMHRDTQTYTGTLNAQSKHLPYVRSYRRISLTFVLQICGADWGLMVDYTWYQNNFLCRYLLMWYVIFFLSSWSSWLVHEPHHLLFDLTQLCLWNLFQTSCIKIKAAWSPWGSSKLYNGGMRFSLRASGTPQTLLQMHETEGKKWKKYSPQQKQIPHSWT